MGTQPVARRKEVHWGLHQVSPWVSWGCSGRRSGLRDGSREPPADSTAIQSRGLRTDPGLALFRQESRQKPGRENVPGLMFRTKRTNVKLIDLYKSHKN